jgi:hypothetical protein
MISSMDAESWSNRFNFWVFRLIIFLIIRPAADSRLVP